jgi:hypothetical protein
MEIQIGTSQKGQYGAVTQSRPLQTIFPPVGPVTDKILNILLGENYYLFENRGNKLTLPTDVWQQIWKYFSTNDKLNLGSIATSFNFIRTSVALIKYNEFFVNFSQYTYCSNVAYCYEKTKKIRDIHENTTIDNVKTICKSILECNRVSVQSLINRALLDIRHESHYVNKPTYQKLKYLNKVFNDPDRCAISCMECQDELRDTEKDCLGCFSKCRNKCCFCCCMNSCSEVSIFCCCYPCCLYIRCVDDGEHCVIQ